MISSFERLIAFRYLKPSKKEGAISIIAGLSFLGIMLGVAALIIVMSVMNGFRAEILRNILGFNGHIGISAPYEGGIQDYDPVVEAVKNLKHVESATPIIERQSMLTANGTATAALVHGVRLKDLMARQLISEKIIRGSLEYFEDDNTIVLGKRLSERLGVIVGDRVTLISPDGNSTAFGTIPRTRTFKIVAIFEVGMKDYDNGVVFMPLKSAQSFFKYGEGINTIEVFVKNPDLVSETTKDIHKTFRGLKVIDWQEANTKFFTTLKVERNVMFTILTLIVLVAALNIISSLIMLVKDKSQDIAILRTIGATRNTIMKIFFLTGSLIGVSGIVAGCTLGLLFCFNIEHIRHFLESLAGTDLFNAEVYFLSQLPAKVEIAEVVLIVCVALFLVFAASVIPAWRAARLDPVEALRYE